jgi:hypothetical protein
MSKLRERARVRLDTGDNFGVIMSDVEGGGSGWRVEEYRTAADNSPIRGMQQRRGR